VGRSAGPSLAWGHEGRDRSDVIEGRGPGKQGSVLNARDDLVAARKCLGKGLRDPAGLDCHDPDAVRAELDGPLPAKRLERIEGDLETAHSGDGLRPPTAEG